MTTPVSAAAAAAREASRSTTGQFGTQALAEAEIDLDAPAPAPGTAVETDLRALLEQYTVLPATDGNGASFETAFVNHYRDAAAFTAAHPDWERLTGEKHLQGLSGIFGEELGDVRETKIVDAGVNDVGEPGTLALCLVTDNGGAARECWHEGDYPYPCTGCAMEDIDELPNYLLDRDSKDESDPQRCWIYFTIPDQDAAATARQAQLMQRELEQLGRIRDGATSPWRHVGKEKASPGAPSRWSQAQRTRSEADSARKLAETSGSTLKLSQTLSERLTPADGSLPDLQQLHQSVHDAPYDALNVRNSPLAGMPRGVNTATAREYARLVKDIEDGRRLIARGEQRIVDADAAMNALGPESEIRQKLESMRKSDQQENESRQRWQARNEEKITKHLDPFRDFVAATSGTDPTELAAEADRLEAEAQRQSMLVGWPEDPERCPSSLEQLRG